MTLEEFDQNHPHPGPVNVKDLYRFMSVDSAALDHLEDLFLKCKLYHSACSDFNDPFEGKPNWIIDNPKEVRAHLKRVAKEKGMNKKMAEDQASTVMKNPHLKEHGKSLMQEALREYRICCFTTTKNNLLLWSHYANSHKGICIEFDPKTSPIHFAQKVDYKNKYPEIKYPSFGDKRAMEPLLVKSKVWGYEVEYRIIFKPGLDDTPQHESSLLLNDPSTITGIYLGAKIEDEDRDALLSIVQKSKFSPKVWQAQLSEEAYELNFELYKP
jgi:hypothetical protein